MVYPHPDRHSLPPIRFIPLPNSCAIERGPTRHHSTRNVERDGEIEGGESERGSHGNAERSNGNSTIDER